MEKVFTDDLKLGSKIILKEEMYGDASVPKNYRTIFIINNE